MKAILYCTKKGEPLPSEDGEILNGKVCAVADIAKADRWFTSETDDDDGLDDSTRRITILRWRNIVKDCEKGISYTDSRVRDSICDKSGMTEREILKYMDGGSAYAIHLKNIEKTIPTDPSTFLGKSIKAPQSWKHVEWEGEDAMLISVLPQWMMKILSGEKTVEWRKCVPAQIKPKIYDKEW